MSTVDLRLDPERDLVAYLCAEYCVDPRLPIYAGGLGVLAGDHLKTASDLGVPLVAVGLLYREGYFRQRLDGHGWQHAEPDPLDPAAAGLEAVTDALGHDLHVSVPFGDHALQLRVWRHRVGRVPLFLLDSDVPDNSPDDRRIAARLYGGGPETRLLQEIVLGIGGVRTIRALGLTPSVWHLNEGHAAFSALERIRQLVANGLSFGAALEVVASCTVFTTHTPVPAGHDVFTHRQLHHWLGDYLGSLNTPERRLLGLGFDGAGHRFSMTALALRTSRFHNGVSRVHRDVAARMEAYVWPGVPPAENPMQHVTNAIHLPSFLAPEWARELDARHPGWPALVLSPKDMDWVTAMPAQSYDGVRNAGKRRLLAELRHRLTEQHRRNGLDAERASRALQLLDPSRDGTLVLGFARRFATYKRAALLLSDPARLAALLSRQGQPVLLVFAGKAHPHDGGGQELIRRLYEFSLQPGFLGRLLVVESYDVTLARFLVQGCDVWLNTPEFPLEASGTSGMKAAVNGAANVSILDGWWAEGCDDGVNGFGIEPAGVADPQERDRLEAQRLFEVLEQRVVAVYFDDRAAWRRLSQQAMRTLIPGFAGARMLSDYLTRLYAPAAQHGRRMRERNSRNAIEFKRWKKMLRTLGPEVRVEIASREPLRARVRLNGLPAQDLTVECVDHAGAIHPLTLRDEDRQGADYELPGPAPARAVLRVVPRHELMAHRFELGCLAVVELGA